MARLPTSTVKMSWHEQITIGASRHMPRNQNWRGQSQFLNRRRERGTVMVESIILISVFVIALLAITFLFGIYNAKFSSMRAAKLDVWGRAMTCSNSASVDASSLENLTNTKEDEQPDDMDSDELIGSEGKGTKGLSGQAIQITSSTRAVCNEQTKPLDCPKMTTRPNAWTPACGGKQADDFSSVIGWGITKILEGSFL